MYVHVHVYTCTLVSKLLTTFSMYQCIQECCFSCQVGGREVALNEVTDEMVASMTAEERQQYTILCQQAMSQLY